MPPYTKKNPSLSNRYQDTELFGAFDDGIFGASSMENIQASGVTPANSAATNRANLLSALTSSNSSYYVPTGDYQISNVAGYVAPTAPNVTLVFAPGARFLFTDNTKGGLRLNTANRVRLMGLNLAYSTPAPAIVADQHALLLEEIDDLLVDGCSIDGPPSMGISLTLCDRPTLKKIRITRTRADGLNIANCLDARADDVRIETTGDDGIAITNYSIYADQSGAEITNVRLKDIGARGIECLGSSNVTVDGFYIDNTLGAGISATYESTYNGTGGTARVMDNIKFLNGTVKNAGAFSGYGHAPITEKSGIQIYNDHATKGTNFVIENVTTEDSLTHGCNVTPGIGRGELNNVTVKRAASFGFFAFGRSMGMSNCTAEECNGSGIVLTNLQQLVINGAVSVNNAKTSGSFLSFGITNTTPSPYTDMRVLGSGLKVIDTQVTNTSSVFYGAADSGKNISGDLGFIESMITDGSRFAIDTPLALKAENSRLSTSGYSPFAFPIGGSPTLTTTTANALVANGGTLAVPVLLTSPMALQSVSFWNTDAATARGPVEFALYRDTTNSANAIPLVTGAVGTLSTWTPSVASLRTISVTSPPVYLAAGAYWLLLKNNHATNTLGLGVSAAGTMAQGVAQTKTLSTAAFGATLDMVAATWTKIATLPGIRLNGRSFGQSIAFS